MNRFFFIFFVMMVHTFLLGAIFWLGSALMGDRFSLNGFVLGTFLALLYENAHLKFPKDEA